jgi:hypothetical protein
MTRRRPDDKPSRDSERNFGRIHPVITPNTGTGGDDVLLNGEVCSTADPGGDTGKQRRRAFMRLRGR